MSERKHTPAPWEVRSHKKTNGDWKVTLIDVPGHPEAIEVRTTEGFPGKETYKVQHADAYLIAASPDLLAACEQAPMNFASLPWFLRAVAEHVHKSGATVMANHIISKANQIEAAIAKATGGTNA
jgi:hypothetical protein